MRITSKTKKAVKSAILITICTLFATWQWLFFSFADCSYGCLEQMNIIYSLKASAPFAYRILTPAIIVFSGNSIMAIILFQSIMFGVFFSLLSIWCAKWNVAQDTVLPLVAIATSYMMPTYYHSLYTIPEWNIWLVALLLIPEWSNKQQSMTSTRQIVLVILVIFGTLNREMTGLLIVLSIFATKPKKVKLWMLSGVAWGITLFALRGLIPATNSYTISNIFYSNTHGYMVNDIVMYGSVIFLIALLLYRNFFASSSRKQIMIIIVLLPYFILWLIYASWSETRLLMPFLIMAIPTLNLPQNAKIG